MNERQQLSDSLKVREMQPFVHPRHLSPTVDYKTRCALEQFSNYTVVGYQPGLTDANRKLIQKALNGLILERTYTARFSMAYLHGFTNSKCTMSNYSTRSSQSTMAAMGRLVNDLEDLEGKEGDEIIEACLECKELRLNQGIILNTDNWHKRYYWSNQGGSHHMAVLCYELQRQNKDWSPVVKISEYLLNVNSLDCLIGRVSIYVVMRDKELYGYDQLFEVLPESLQNEAVWKRLGVSIPYTSHYLQPFKDYQLVFVDHGQIYADIAESRLNEAVNAGVAMNFIDFLKGWVAEDDGIFAIPVQ
ncbi:MAG: DUF6685 family protein [Candidatus Thiodiazotropha sp.]